MPSSKLKEFTDFFSTFEGFLNKKEFEQFTKLVLQIVTKLGENLKNDVNNAIAENNAARREAIKSIEQAKKDLQQAIKDNKKANDSTYAQVKQRTQESIANMFAKLGIQSQVNEALADFKVLADEAKSKIDAINIDALAKKAADLVEPIEETPEELANKLRLPQGEDKIHIEDIWKLREELDNLKKRIGNGSGSVIAYSRGQIKLYDLSDSLDGVTKTFSLPAFWRVLTVQSSSFPNALRPTVDYTTDGSAMTITFTSEIDAATTLATGQTLTVLYAEP